MPTVDASNSRSDFDLAGDLVQWDRGEATDVTDNAPDSVAFTNGTDQLLTFIGTNLAGSSTDDFTAGTITQITNSFQADSTVDVSITGLSLAAAGLAMDPTALWDAILAGSTTLIASDFAFSRMVGDAIGVGAGETFTGASDTFTGSATAVGEFAGDVVSNSGTVIGADDVFQNLSGGLVTEPGEEPRATTVIGDVALNDGDVTGGNDTFNIAFGGPALEIVGDVLANEASGASTTGGSDTITFSNTAVISTIYAYGDVEFLDQGTSATGGNDMIDLSQAATDVTYLTGDASDIDGSLVGGDDTIVGSAGDDVISGDAAFVNQNGQLQGGNDTIYGGDGDDTISGDYEQMSGTLISGGDDFLFGERGNDTIFGNEGNDTIRGGEGIDTLDGGAGADDIYGDEGNDILLGGDQNDNLYGGSGNDQVLGQRGADFLYGGAGNDLVLGGNRNDRLFGEDGNDRVFGGNDQDIIDGGAGIDIGRGGNGDDQVSGGDDGDVLFGGTGRDTVSGDGGDDVLFGRGGFDILIGGAGDDTLEGGLQADQFIFADGFGNDTITDFASLANGEKIHLTDVSEITDFQDLIDNHMSQVGSDVVIADGLGNTITLQGVQLSDLDAVDFVF